MATGPERFNHSQHVDPSGRLGASVKTLTSLAITAALLASPLVQAGGAIDPKLAGCQAELQAHFGEQASFKLVNSRRNPQGTRLRVAAQVDADHSYFADCWVPVNDVASLEEGKGRPQLAVSQSTTNDR